MESFKPDFLSHWFKLMSDSRLWFKLQMNHMKLISRLKFHVRKNVIQRSGLRIHVKICAQLTVQFWWWPFQFQSDGIGPKDFCSLARLLDRLVLDFLRWSHPVLLELLDVRLAAGADVLQLPSYQDSPSKMQVYALQRFKFCLTIFFYYFNEINKLIK